VPGVLREPLADPDSRAWLDALQGAPAVREQAVARLHALLLRAARFELARRGLTQADADDLATQAADDALMAILDKLDTFAGRSRFTTWAYKFAILEAAVLARRRAWGDREVRLDDRDWSAVEPSAQQILEDAEVLAVVRDAMRDRMTPHQRRVFTALALDGVPIDVLAERMGCTRGALYKTLHDARRKLRSAVEEAT
jgi:RNA polymerase sigma-70 factor (ECF subfamily)